MWLAPQVTVKPNNAIGKMKSKIKNILLMVQKSHSQPPDMYEAL